MKKYFAYLLVAMSSAVAFTSCSDDEKNTDYIAPTRHITDYFSIITDNSTGAVSTTDDTSMALTYNYSGYKATITLTNVPTSAGGAVGTYTFSDLPMQITTHTSTLVDVYNVKPDGVPGLNFSHLYIDVKDRNYDGRYAPLITAYYTIGNLTVRLASKVYYYVGQTQVVGSATFSTYAPTYALYLDPGAGTAQIDIKDARFSSDMEKVDMRFMNIPMNLTETGFTLVSDGFNPMIGVSAHPEYHVADFRGNGTFAGKLNLAFNMSGKGSVKCTLDTEFTEAPPEEDSDKSISRSIEGYYSLAHDASGTSALIPGASVDVTLNLTNSKSTVKLNNVVKDQAGEISSYILSNVPTTRTSANPLAMRINASDITPDGMSTVKISSLSVNWRESVFRGEPYTFVSASYVLNGNTSAVLIAPRYNYTGIITVTPPSPLETSTLNQASLFISADSTGELTLYTSDGEIRISNLEIDFVTGGMVVSADHAALSVPGNIHSFNVSATYAGDLTLSMELIDSSDSITSYEGNMTAK